MADTVGARLAALVLALMAERRLNQTEVGRLLGLHQSHISAILAGGKGVSISKLDQIAERLHVDVSDLLRRQEKTTEGKHKGLTATAELDKVVLPLTTQSTHGASSAPVQRTPSGEVNAVEHLRQLVSELLPVAEALFYAIARAEKRLTPTGEQAPTAGADKPHDGTRSRASD